MAEIFYYFIFLGVTKKNFLFFQQDEKRLRGALLFANACGALTVTERGAIPALPTRKTVLELLSPIAG